MKTKDIVAICNFFNNNIENLKLSKSKKVEVKANIKILRRSLKHKNPVEYLKDRLSEEQIAELIQVIIDFHKSP